MSFEYTQLCKQENTGSTLHTRMTVDTIICGRWKYVETETEITDEWLKEDSRYSNWPNYIPAARTIFD